MLYFTRWKTFGIALIALIVVFVGLAFFWAQQRIAPSLEAQGGTYLVLEVDSNYLKKQKLIQIRDDTRRVLREARIGFIGLSVKDDAVEVRVRDTALLPTALAKLRDLPVGLDSKGQHNLEVADAGEGLIRLSGLQAVVAEQLPLVVEQSIGIIEKRVEGVGTAAPIIQRQGANRILVQLPGLWDPTRLNSLCVYRGRLEFRMVDTSVSPDQAKQGELPRDAELLESAFPPNIPYVVKKQVLVDGSDLIDARPGFDQRSNEPVINFKFNFLGARKFAQATTENVGFPFAIVLDNKVISTPRINEPITGGQGQISGNFTVESAKDLAILLRAGALPAPLIVVEERTVGPGHGQGSIESDGKRAKGEAIRQ